MTENAVLADLRRLDRHELWRHRHKDAWTAVLFFWAGKATPRELEEFIFDLLEEDEVSSLLLALSLMEDQGDRLMYDTQRELALMLTRKRYPIGKARRNHRWTTGRVPRKFYSYFAVEEAELRGLSRSSGTYALATMFSRGVLKVEDIRNSSETFVDPLTIGLLWAMCFKQSHVRIGDAKRLTHLSSMEQALYCANAYLINKMEGKNVTASEFIGMLDEWRAVFPNERSYLVLVVIGMYSEIMDRGQQDADVRKMVGGVILSGIEEPIDNEWLEGSAECFNGMKETVDILEWLREDLKGYDAMSWGISDEEHRRLVAWCLGLIAKRSNVGA